MNIEEVPENYIEVSKQDFDQFLENVQYKRTAYGDAIIYHNYKDETIGIIFESKKYGEMYFLNPKFLKDDSYIELCCAICGKRRNILIDHPNLPLNWFRITGAYDPEQNCFEFQQLICDKHLIKIEDK